ncbi:MAG: hypothetical protein IJT27_07460 [Clostridia bacterium]|nr:hypothetical protein [Clostridia bacterium]
MREFFIRVWEWIKRVFHIKSKNDVVCYYGCPNSNKAAKLQLSKTLYR